MRENNLRTFLGGQRKVDFEQDGGIMKSGVSPIVIDGYK